MLFSLLMKIKKLRLNISPQWFMSFPTGFFALLDKMYYSRRRRGEKRDWQLSLTEQSPHLY